MAERSRRNDDPAWSPGHQQARLAQRNSRPARGRKPIPIPRQEELESLSESEKIKVARRLRNRASATSSRRKAQAATTPPTLAPSVPLEEQIEELQEENARLQEALADRDTQLDTLTTKFAELKAQIEQLKVPAAAAKETLHDEDQLMLDHQQSSQADHSIFENAPPLTPTTTTAAQRGPAPVLAPTPIADCDLHTVMQWSYPGLALPGGHEVANLEEDIPLVFTPFAPSASPRDSLLTPGGGGQAGFGAWRPSLRGVEECEDHVPRENSGVARDMARMASSPAAFFTQSAILNDY